MDNVTVIGQVALALLLGGVLGWQRLRRGRSAGPRTYALVAGGAALFTILSTTAFGGADPARVASQIVVGIGFLGAGMIIQREDRVEGLTTAAGLWMAAALGMAVGVRMYLIAVILSLIVLGILFLDDRKIKRTIDENVKVE